MAGYSSGARELCVRQFKSVDFTATMVVHERSVFRRPVRARESAIGLDGQRILIWPEHDLVVSF